MAISEKACRILEFDKILQLLSETARTEGAKAEALRIRPQTEPERIRRLQKETSDACALITVKTAPPLDSITDVTEAVGKAEKGATLSPAELLSVGGLLRSARRLLAYIDTDRRIDTVLDVIFHLLTPNRYLEDKIARVIPAEGIIADEASPALSDIRRKIRSANNRIRELLQKYTSGGPHAKYLQEPIVTQRNGRFVIPVKAEYRNEIKGLVHDTSASGATLFVEPLSVVEANNDLRFLENEEQKEIDRILAELSAEVADASGALTGDYQIITRIALIFARAELSFRMRGSEPQFNENGKIRLLEARHPLLDPSSVVPITVSLGEEYDTLVITGPNTGGKTVTLKTVGLLVLMAQSGLHLPASSGTEVCVFDRVFADIGDEQSIEQSLSTFSAHMTNIVSILNALTDRSLVLFDELGAGTDPVEGAALAVSILEYTRKIGARCAATTHYAELKAYALETPGVRNASCEFDVATLRPTYRLLIGAPGKSNAFAISERLGLRKDIVKRAQDLISAENRSLEGVISKLDAQRREMEQTSADAARLKKEYEEKAAEAEKRLGEARARAEKELEDARAKAANLLTSARSSADYVFAELDGIRKKKDSSRFSEELEQSRREVRQKLREAGDTVDPVERKASEGYVLPRPLEIGDEVYLINLDLAGKVMSLPDRDGLVQVQAGVLRTKVSPDELMLASDRPAPDGDRKKKKPGMLTEGQLRASIQKSFRPELDLRGEYPEDAWLHTDRYLDDAVLSGIRSVTLIHGKGTGALRKALWDRLKRDARVKSYRAGSFGEGDYGVTVVELK
ncbi:MAG: endonuclease MutS2 [Clostridia bacterium]|nr:endonuclease MutS2 [Clostridia bacterium]